MRTLSVIAALAAAVGSSLAAGQQTAPTVPMGNEAGFFRPQADPSLTAPPPQAATPSSVTPQATTSPPATLQTNPFGPLPQAITRTGPPRASSTPIPRQPTGAVTTPPQVVTPGAPPLVVTPALPPQAQTSTAPPQTQTTTAPPQTQTTNAPPQTQAPAPPAQSATPPLTITPRTAADSVDVQERRVVRAEEDLDRAERESVQAQSKAKDVPAPITGAFTGLASERDR